MEKNQSPITESNKRYDEEWEDPAAKRRKLNEANTKEAKIENMQNQFDDLLRQVRFLTPRGDGERFDWFKSHKYAKLSLDKCRDRFTELIQSTFFKSDEIQVWREKINAQDKVIRETEVRI